MIGRTLGHYKIVEKLGQGGMGVVYLAKDTKLRREVALKVLPQGFAHDSERLVRFRREAQLLASLNHKNIATIYAFEEYGEASFLVLELVEGRTLADLIRDSCSGTRDSGVRMSSAEVLRIATQIAVALEYAHKKGITHRDIKPANIKRTPEGEIKVLDFGLAKAVEGDEAGVDLSELSTLTEAPAKEGKILGTPAYMSPEQVRGKAVDKRTDNWAFGCVLYELLTGQRAFLGETVSDTLSAVLTREPNWQALPPGTPAKVRELLRRCLQKDPSRRLYDIADARIETEEALKHGIRRREPSRGVRRRGLPRKPIQVLAVLPLANLSRDPEQEYFVDGMTEALISDLARIRALQIISRTSAMRYKRTDKSLPEIAEELNVDGVVEGSVLRVGQRVRITVQLIHGGTDTHLWAQSYERDLQDVLCLQGEVSQAIASQIEIAVTPREEAHLAAARSVNPKAYEAYLSGRYLLYRWSAEAAEQALAHFEEALSIDPSYAPAYAAIADAYMNLGTGFAAAQPATVARPKGKVAALKALELDPDLAEAHAALAGAHLCYDWEWTAAATGFSRAIELKPNYAPPHQWQALVLAVQRELGQALEAAKRAQELDLLAPYPGTLIGQILYYMRRYGQAREQLKKVIARDPEFALAYFWLARTFLAESAYTEALAEFHTAVQLTGRSPVMLGPLGHGCGVAGRAQDARELLRELSGLAQQRYVPAYSFAEIHSGLGDQDKALEWLARAQTERSDLLIFLSVEPIWDGLRSAPRFQDLLRRIGLPS